MSVEADIKEFIASELVTGERGTQLTESEALISSGLVDSMGLLQILSFVQQKFGVDLMTVASPQDFDSVTALAAAVRRHTRE